MKVTLQVLTDFYGKPDKSGKQKLIKRNVKSKKQFETMGITAEEYVNSKGIPSKRWSMIKYDGEYFKVGHKFEDIEKLTSNVKWKGFSYGNDNS